MAALETAFWESVAAITEKFEHKYAAVYCDNIKVLARLTYKEIFRISEVLYKAISDLKDINELCIGLLMEHNPFIPAVVMCIHRLKCAFMFLDTHDPDINKLVAKVNIKYVLTFCDIHQENEINEFTLILSIPINETDILELRMCKTHETGAHCFKDVNYVVQTSGTTGAQKVVKVEHYCIVSNINSLREKFAINENDVIYFGTNLTFDPSVVELYLALTTGACLLIVPPRIRKNPSLLYKTLFLTEFTPKLTFLQMCPSVLLRWNEAEIQHIFQNCLRLLVLGGEAFPKKILRCRKSERLDIFNVYGITEVSCWASVGKVNGTENDVSLGVPLCDTILEVRNEDGRKISEGDGELYIGSYKRLCYVNEETQSTIHKPVFRATGDTVMLKSGQLYYKNRKNDIIKRYGFRVNLQDAENQVFDETKLENTFVWLKDKLKLLLFIKITEPDKRVQEKIIDKLRIKLLHCLKKEAFPDNIEVISTFPVTRNGKINKKALESIALQSANIAKDNRDLLRVFDDLWFKYSGLCKTDLNIYRNCSFYDLGGNSILSQQFSAELKDVMQIDYTTDFLDYLLSNTYEESCNFIKLSSSVEYKRKCVGESGELQSKVFKRDTDISLKVLWEYNLQACVDSSPRLLKNSSMVGIGGFSHVFALLNAEDGKEITKVILPDAIENACCSSSCGNFVFIGCYNGYMYCIDIHDGSIVWHYETDDKIKNEACLVLQDSAIVFGSYDKFIHCVDIQKGSGIWKTNLSESVTSNPVYIESKKCVCIATIHGTCFCVNENTGDVVWKLKVGSPVFGSPCIFERLVIWPGVLGSLFGVCCETGSEIWRFQAGGHVYSSITTHKKCVTFGCHDKYVYCLEPNNTSVSVKFKVLLDSVISAGVCKVVHNNYDYIAAVSTTGTLYLIDFISASIVVKFVLQGEIFSTPIVNDDKIFVGCRDNNLYCIGIKTERSAVHQGLP